MFIGGDYMSAQKRRIKAELFVRDLRLGLGEEDLMRKYDLSRVQLYGVFQKLVNTGTVDAMEVYMRTSLTDTGIITFVAETVLQNQEGAQMAQSQAPEPLDSVAEVKPVAHVAGPGGNLFNTISDLCERLLHGSGDRES
jgi:hypothetical protein